MGDDSPLRHLIRIHNVVPLRALCRCGDQIDFASIWSHVPRAGTTRFAQWANCGIFDPWSQSGPDAACSIIVQSTLLSQATLQFRGIFFGYHDGSADTDGKKISFPIKNMDLILFIYYNSLECEGPAPTLYGTEISRGHQAGNP
jgi:hypothetical protein